MQKVRLEDVCEILDSRRVPITASERKAGKYPYYGANGLQDYVDGFIFDDELVLLAEDGGNFGSKDKPIAYRVSGKCWVNNHAHVLKAKEGVVDTNFLCYSLMFYDVSNLVNGATRQKLTQKDMRKMQIPLPPMEEQRAIAEKLDKVSQLVDKRKEQLQQLDQLVKSKFITIFGGTETKNFQICQLGNVVKIGSSKRIFEKEYQKNGVPFYRSKEIIELAKKQSVSTQLYISRERYEEIRKEFGCPNIGDLLITAVGTIGVIWMVDTERPFYFKDGNLIRIEKSTHFNSVFLKYLLTDLIDEYKVKMATGTAYSALTIQGLKGMQLPLPPIDLQNKFAEFVEKVDKLKEKVNKSLTHLNLLKQSLMQQYFG